MNIFQETQKFKQRWIYFSLFIPVLILLVVIINQLAVGKKLEDNIGIYTLLFTSLILSLLLVLLFYIIELKTLVDENGISIQFKPLMQSHINWSEIKKLDEFVGYGIRMSLKYYRVYNISGNKGLLIELKNGKKIVVGTQNEKELKAFIETHNITL
jgi:hypothetical protein